MRNVHVQTSVGVVSLSGEDAAFRKPATILIHGACGNAGDLAPFGRELPNPLYVHLPGHDAPSLNDNSFAGWLTGLREALSGAPTPHLVLGESLGGLLALCLPYRALAIDPPLRTHNLWPVRILLGRPAAERYRPALTEIFAEGQDYTPFIRGGDVIAGDVPLMPPRYMDSLPSLFEREVAPPSLRVHALGGGHTIARRRRAECLQIIREVTALQAQ